MADKAELEQAENIGSNPNLHEREGAEAACPYCYGTGTLTNGCPCPSCGASGRVPVEGPTRMQPDYGGKASIDW